MKMLNIVCGETLEEKILALLKNLGIKGYTMVKGVGGSGQTGIVSGTGASIDRNTLFMVALEDDHIHMTQVLNGVREIHTKHVHGYRGLEIPLKVFLLPCEVIL
jgi:PII-like signaling protein